MEILINFYSRSILQSFHCKKVHLVAIEYFHEVIKFMDQQHLEK